jgi:hypothetical protein
MIILEFLMADGMENDLDAVPMVQIISGIEFVAMVANGIKIISFGVTIVMIL